MRAFNVVWHPRYQFSKDGRWVVTPVVSRKWSDKRFAHGRIWQLSKHSWRWYYRDMWKNVSGRATTKDQAIQAMIRSAKGYQTS